MPNNYYDRPKKLHEGIRGRDHQLGDLVNSIEHTTTIITVSRPELIDKYVQLQSNTYCKNR